jgi:DNA-binding NtrC family response regulator
LDEHGEIDARVSSALRNAFRLEEARDLDHVGEGPFAVVVIAPGAKSPGALCQRVLAEGVSGDVVVLGVQASLRDAISAIRAGAIDFVPEGDRPSEVVARVAQAVESNELRSELGFLEQAPLAPVPFPELIGSSIAMEQVRKRLGRVAGSDVTMLLTGESGTGKEIVARALHAHGPRKNGPFVAISSAIPKQLVESELFGYSRGAFTDATASHAGLLVQANGGTLLLDEVGDMPLDVQAKLLRALQQRAIRPLGRHEEIAFDVRLIAATRLDLEAEVRAGRFREDLFFRLNVVGVRMPPLRARDRDVLELAHHFIRRDSSETRKVVGLTPAAARALLGYAWPGNVRELEHCVLSAVASARYDHLRAVDLPIPGLKQGVEPEAPKVAPWSEVERVHILRVLDSVSGNKAQAARLLGLDRKTLSRKLRSYAETIPRPPLESRPD